MCGIVGYVGNKEAYPIIIDGLKKLEYRGYDSAGVALLHDHSIQLFKKKGRVSALEETVVGEKLTATIGIGHTRWATHGAPSDRNAHPHYSNSKSIAMIHNGIIENYSQLKAELITKGYVFHSDTDSEVLLNFIEDIKINNNSTLEEAVRIALKRVTGAYVILLIDIDLPDTIIAARKGSPLVIGIGDNEHFLGSDASPMLAYTKDVVYINDYELAIITSNELILKNIGNERVTPFIQRLDLNLSQIEKGGYEHFMLKEIFEQPQTINDSFRGRLDVSTHSITLSGLDTVLTKLDQAQRIVIVGCGTSWHAGLLAEYIIEELCRINVEVEYASEFRYRNPIITDKDFIIAVSQSGETADTLVALEKAKGKGATIFGVVNVVGSSIARLADAGMYTHAGPEIGVASTKAFTAQVVALILFALKVAHHKRTFTDERYKQLIEQLSEVPTMVEWIFATQLEKIKHIAYKYANAKDFLYLGRGYNFPIALEGALKLKEISYIHAEGYPAAEMKHGPIALVDDTLPIVFVATKDSYHEKIVSNMQEVKAREGRVIAVISVGDELTKDIADDYIEVPYADEIISPLLSTIPLQLLSYYIGVSKGLNVDMPRNLAKSVTVE